MRNESEFYVGYLPIPAGLKTTTRVLVVAVGVLVVMVAAILIIGQNPFAAATFEFRQYRDFRGTLLTEPYPALAIRGQDPPFLLVGPGKHGIGDLRQWSGREVALKGERVYRPSGRAEDHMIELLPGSLAPDGKAIPVQGPEDLGDIQLTGEIVNSKCYFGVMNPAPARCTAIAQCAALAAAYHRRFWFAMPPGTRSRSCLQIGNENCWSTSPNPSKSAAICRAPPAG